MELPVLWVNTLIQPRVISAAVAIRVAWDVRELHQTVQLQQDVMLELTFLPLQPNVSVPARLTTLEMLAQQSLHAQSAMQDVRNVVGLG